MIKAVIFDVGGVLICTEDPQPRARAEQRVALAPGGAEALVLNSERGRLAQHGNITTAELWTWVGERLKLDDLALETFQRDFWAGDQLDHELLAFVRALRPKYQTAIISNFYDDQRRLLTEDFPLLDAFDLYVCSAYEGIMKPDAAIYERTLSRLGRAPEEVVFIDDSLPNIEGARAVGMQAVHYTPRVDLPAELAKLGVCPDGNP